MKLKRLTGPAFGLAMVFVFWLWPVSVQAEKNPPKDLKEEERARQEEMEDRVLDPEVAEEAESLFESEQTKPRYPAEDDYRWWKELPWSEEQLEKNKQFILDHPEYFTRGDPNGNINDHIAIVESWPDRFGRIDLEDQVARNLDFIERSGWMKDKVFCEALGKDVSIMNPYVDYSRLNLPAAVSYASGLAEEGIFDEGPGVGFGCQQGSSHLMHYASNGTATWGHYMHQQEIPAHMAHTDKSLERAWERSGMMQQLDTIPETKKIPIPPMDFEIRGTPIHYCNHLQGWTISNGQNGVPLAAGGNMTTHWHDKEWSTDLSGGTYDTNRWLMVSERPQVTPPEYAAELKSKGLTPLAKPEEAVSDCQSSDPLALFPMPASGKWDDPYPYSPRINRGYATSGSGNGNKQNVALSRPSSLNSGANSSNLMDQALSALSNNRPEKKSGGDQQLQNLLLQQQMESNKQISLLIKLLESKKGGN